jgi:hypothetical protein
MFVQKVKAGSQRLATSELDWLYVDARILSGTTWG